MNGIVRLTRAQMVEAQRTYFYEVVLAYEGDECLIWPFIKKADGYAVWNGGADTALASRQVCIEVNGPPPTPEHHAAHSCGNGHLACVTKRHLSWKTRAENMADMVAHGRSNRGARAHSAKLTETDVLAILASTAERGADLARRYRVSSSRITEIRKGKSWAWIDRVQP